MSFPFYFTWSDQTGSGAFDLMSTDGSFLEVRDHGKVFDFSSLSFQMNFGHNNQMIVDPVKMQMDQFSAAPTKALFGLKERVSNNLLDLINLDSGKIFYTVSGAEAVENGLKMMRRSSGKEIILAKEHSYHGASLGALSVTGDWRNVPHKTYDDGTVRIPDWSDDPKAEKIEEIILNIGAERIAGFCLETVSGVNGVSIAPKSWWDKVQELCTKYDLLLLLDEVLTGFGRTGRPFCFQHFGIKPDLVTLSKGITGGIIPFGAVWTGDKVTTFYDSHKLVCGLTNFAHPLGLAAASGVLEIMESSEWNSNFTELEKVFKTRLSKFSQITRSIGLLGIIEVDNKFELNDFLSNGIYTVFKNDRILLAPPTTCTVEELNKAFDQLEKVIK